MAKEMPLEKIVPSAETEWFVHGNSNATEPFGQAISSSDALQAGEIGRRLLWL